jgi:exopolyphosphatase/guanosine-5'-triphosphate,3'-diphosphate pyrophosphatase
VGGSITQLIGVGGTVTSLAAVKHKMTQYDPDIIQGSMLGLEELNEQIALYASKTIQERKRIVGLSPKRAEIILGGACIVKVIMEMMSMDFLTVSNRGLRHALAYEWFNGK